MHTPGSGQEYWYDRDEWFITLGAYPYEKAPTPVRAPKLPRVICGARTRKGTPCRCQSEPGRTKCRHHGGLSTGPKTSEGRAKISEANRIRWAKWRQEPEQKERAKWRQKYERQRRERIQLQLRLQQEVAQWLSEASQKEITRRRQFLKDFLIDEEGYMQQSREQKYNQWLLETAQRHPKFTQREIEIAQSKYDPAQWMTERTQKKRQHKRMLLETAKEVEPQEFAQRQRGYVQQRREYRRKRREHERLQEQFRDFHSRQLYLARLQQDLELVGWRRKNGPRRLKRTRLQQEVTRCLLSIVELELKQRAQEHKNA